MSIVIDRNTQSSASFLSFRLEQEIFAVPIQQVHEILEFQRITIVPKTSKHILGVINRRGDILPVLNTHSLFNIQRNNNTAPNEIMVMEIEYGDKKVIVGAVIDSAQDVQEILEDEIVPIPDVGGMYNNNYFIGAKQMNNYFILLLNANNVFSIDRLL